MANSSVLSTYSFAIKTVTNMRQYISIPYYSYTYQDLPSILFTSVSACKIHCESTATCNTVVIFGGQCYVKFGTVAPVYYDLITASYLVIAATPRTYQTQTSVYYNGTYLLHYSGNPATCATACDTLMNCVGFVIDSTSTCYLQSVMDTTTGMSNLLYTAYIISVLNMNAVNVAISTSLEVSVGVKQPASGSTYTPTLPLNAPAYIGCFTDSSPSVFSTSASIASYTG